MHCIFLLYCIELSIGINQKVHRWKSCISFSSIIQRNIPISQLKMNYPLLYLGGALEIPEQQKQEHKVSYRCSLPSPLQKRSKDNKGSFVGTEFLSFSWSSLLSLTSPSSLPIHVIIMKTTECLLLVVSTFSIVSLVDISGASLHIILIKLSYIV